MGRLRTREEYLKTERNVYELLWNTSAFLSGKSKSLKKGSVNPSFPTGTVKEIDRDEEEFKAFNKTISSILLAINSSISSFSTF
jgi:hypothetical protein